MLPPRKLVLLGLLTSFAGAFQVGYVLVLPSTTGLILQRFLNDSFVSHYGTALTDSHFRLLWSFFLSTSTIGFLVAGFILRPVADTFGRKGCLVISVVFVLVGAVLSGLSKMVDSFELYMVGRFVSSLFGMVMMSAQPLYITELAQKQYRGFINGLSGIVNFAGAAVAFPLALPMVFGTEELWPWLHWLQVIPCVLFLVAIPAFPESPKHLLLRGRVDAARAAAAAFRSSEAEVDELLDEFRAEMAMTGGGAMTLLSVWRQAAVRRGAILACVVNAALGLNGHIAIVYFGPHFLRLTGLTDVAASYANMAVWCLGVAGATLSTVLLDRVGRRPLLMVSYAATEVLDVCIMAALWTHAASGAAWAAAAIGAAMGAFIFVAGLGVAQVAMFIGAELVPQSARAATQSAAVIVRYVTMTASGLIYYPLDGRVGPISYLMFIIPMGIILVYLYCALPETKQRNVTEIKQFHTKKTYLVESADQQLLSDKL